MSQKYGFFNSIGDDRLYNAETFNRYFEGIISQIGIFSNVGTKLNLTLDTQDGIKAYLDTGKALVNSHWFMIEGDQAVIELPSPHSSLDRIDLIVLRWNEATGVKDFWGNSHGRDVYIDIIKGTTFKSGGSVVYPSYRGRTNEVVGSGYGIDSRDGVVDLPLYAIRVNHDGKASIALDYRGNQECPYISHLVIGPSQADVETYLHTILQSIKDFNSQLQEELNVVAHLNQYSATISGGSNVSNTFDLEETIGDYNYDPGDIIFCFYNGMMLSRGSNKQDGFIVEETGETAILTTKGSMASGNSLYILILKSEIGAPVYEDGTHIKY